MTAIDTSLEKLVARIKTLQDELDAEISRRGKAFRYRLENGRVVFEAEAREQHRKLRIRLKDFLARTKVVVVLTAPFIYMLIVPFVLLDLFVWVYQSICFPAYGIPKVPRRDHVRIDRQHLAYLNALQKLNCVYCGYCNGVIGWVREVAARTEAYWCPIKHAGRVVGPHRHYVKFVDFGDAEGFAKGIEESRKDVTQL